MASGRRGDRRSSASSRPRISMPRGGRKRAFHRSTAFELKIDASPISRPKRKRGDRMKTSLKLAFVGCAMTALSVSAAEARVTRIEIEKTDWAFGGGSFGNTGPYQRLTGRVMGELDPADPANAIIEDIDLAPRNARGMIEYTTPIEILKPADMARGNRILFFEVHNRGNKLALNAFDEGVTGGAADRNGLTSPGDGWLLRSGYTMVWFGWEMDVLPGMSRIGMPPVIAHNHDGSSVTGIVRSEMI